MVDWRGERIEADEKKLKSTYQDSGESLTRHLSRHDLLSVCEIYLSELHR